MIDAEHAQLALALGDLGLEVVDRHEAGVHGLRPRVRQREAFEQLTAFGAKQV